MKQLLIIIFILIAGGAKGYTKDFDYSHITPHPRLLLKEGEERNIHMVLQKNTVLQAFHKRILDYCDETLKEPPVKRIKEGKRNAGCSFFHRLESQPFPGCKRNEYGTSHWIRLAIQ